MKIKQALKLYIPMEYLEEDNLVNVPEDVLAVIDNYYNEFTTKYGGITIYDAMGRYYNKTKDKIFSIKTKIMEVYVPSEQTVNAYKDIIQMATYIKTVLKQENVAITIDNDMRFV